MTVDVVVYKPPPTIEKFILDYRPGGEGPGKGLFFDYIIGAIGSGKTTGLFFKLVYMAGKQEPDKDGIRRTKAVVVRNSLPQLKDTTMASWNEWFKEGQAGYWRITENKFILKSGDIECEVLFRPLDTSADIQRVLSLDVSFAIVDEFVNIPREIIDALGGRCGRYPKGRCTNWGMWGSSNPSTEDNWWYDYLHNLPENSNVKYFTQPSGLSPNAENIENLPGKRGYYTALAIGKSDAWIHQFIMAEWGFSVSGTPVVPTFKPDMHISKSPLIFNPELPMIVGFDPGMGGSAFVFGQQDLHSRLSVLGELVQSNIGVSRLVTERLKPFLRVKFPEAKVVIAPDPAAANRAQTDEKTIVQVIERHFPVKYETNNRLPLRLNAIDSFTTRLTDIGPAIQIDAKECPQLIRALKGGWRYAIDTRKDTQKPEPDDNRFTHVGDAFGYLCRYFHRSSEREAKYAMQRATNRNFAPAQSGGYHFR